MTANIRTDSHTADCRNILLSGVGGQGTVLASKLIARAAIARGQTAHTAETIGMAQRGGCVVSHVRVGDGAFSPLIPKGQADTVIAFEPAEAVRVLPYLKVGGTVVCSIAAIKPVTDALAASGYEGSTMTGYLRKTGVRLVLVDGAAIAAECGAKSLNMALLGAAAAAGVIGLTPEELRVIVTDTLSPKFREQNLKALDLGAAAAQEVQ